MVKLIASDIDGTLLPEGTARLDPSYFTVIRELKKHGVLFAGASGRGAESVHYLFEPVARDILFMGHNGAYAVQGGNMLYEMPFSRERLAEIMRVVRELDNAFFMVSAAWETVTECADEALLDWIHGGYGLDPARMQDVMNFTQPVLKVAVYEYGDPKNTSMLLSRRLQGTAQVFISGSHWIDISPPGVSKGAGLEKLGSLLGIRRDEIMAFGDNINDIPMLEYAGLSYAVENATDEAKKAARFAAADCREAGVLKVLRSVLREREAQVRSAGSR